LAIEVTMNKRIFQLIQSALRRENATAQRTELIHLDRDDEVGDVLPDTTVPLHQRVDRGDATAIIDQNISRREVVVQGAAR
jgi:hypothetical protein